MDKAMEAGTVCRRNNGAHGPLSSLLLPFLLQVYDREGNVVPSPPDLELWTGDDVVPVRCPHPPTACKMATLIRKVKSEQDSIGKSTSVGALGALALSLSSRSSS